MREPLWADLTAREPWCPRDGTPERFDGPQEPPEPVDVADRAELQELLTPARLPMPPPAPPWSR